MAKSPSRVDDPSYVVGPSRFAELAGRSRKWAAAVLRRWKAEEDRGGPRRVVWASCGGRPTWCTTLGVIQAMGLGRDSAFLRRIERLEKDLDFAARRLNDEVASRRALEGRVASLEGRVLRALREQVAS